MWTVLSGVFGGLLRLVPEIFKMINAKGERAHELAMQKVAYDFQVLKGNQRIDEIQEQGQADWNTGALDALQAAIKAQAKPSGVRWIDGFNSLIRPLVAFEWLVMMYPAIIITTFVVAFQSGTPVVEAMNRAFGPEEKAIVAFLIDFFFIGRVLDAGRKLRGRP